MKQKGGMIFKVLLNQYHRGREKKITERLPKMEEEIVLTQIISSNEIPKSLFSSSERLLELHYSWLILGLKGLSKNHLLIVFSSLPLSYQESLKNILSIKNNTLSIPPLIKSYVLNQFYHSLNLHEPYPPSWLPQTPLSKLVHADKKKLVNLIDFLGLYDLAQTIRQIVDKQLLVKIYQCLTPKKSKFLRFCIHQKEKFPLPEIDLQYWQGEKEKLLKVLHHKGIIRFGLALSGQDLDLIWTITHTLDKGRGEKLARSYQENSVENKTNYAIQQVLAVLNFFEKEKQ